MLAHQFSIIGRWTTEINALASPLNASELGCLRDYFYIEMTLKKLISIAISYIWFPDMIINSQE